MSTTTITTGGGLLCLYKSNRLYAVHQSSSGGSVTLSTDWSYIEHDTPADISAWMASNNISSAHSDVLRRFRRYLSGTRDIDPTYEALFIAVSMPTGEEGLINAGDIEETGAGE